MDLYAALNALDIQIIVDGEGEVRARFEGFDPYIYELRPELSYIIVTVNRVGAKEAGVYDVPKPKRGGRK